jgi:hypothetical protein
MPPTPAAPSAAPIVVGALLIALSIFVGFWALIGWTVTASTGVPTEGQDAAVRAIGWLCVVAFVVGFVLIVRGVRRLSAAKRSKRAV